MPNVPPLSDMSRQVLTLAERKAAFFQHEDVQAEHVLLAIVDVPETEASAALRRHNLGVDTIVQQIVGQMTIGFGRGDRQVDRSPAVQRLVTTAGQEALRLGSQQTGTGHLLLGIMAEREGSAARVLAQLGLRTQALREHLASQASTETAN